LKDDVLYDKMWKLFLSKIKHYILMRTLMFLSIRKCMLSVIHTSCLATRF